MFDKALGAIADIGMKIFAANEAENAAEAARVNSNHARLEDYIRQKEFAQSGIRWKVEDAKAAGLHPLYALGGSGASYTPSAINLPVSNAPNIYASMGQDISRAINATRTQPERDSAFDETVKKLSLEKMGLENQLLGSQIAKVNSTLNPPMATGADLWRIPGQSGSGLSSSSPLVSDKAMERAPGAPGAPWSEPGAISSTGFAQTPTGGYEPVPSKDVKERIEDNLILEAAWAIKNRIAPNFGFRNEPPTDPGKGKIWDWSYRNQEWVAVEPHKSRNAYTRASAPFHWLFGK